MAYIHFSQFSAAVTVWPCVRVSVWMCCFFLCVIFATVCVCVCVNKVVRCSPPGVFPSTRSHSHTPKPQHLGGSVATMGPLEGNNQQKCIEKKRGEMLCDLEIFCDLDSAWKAEGGVVMSLFSAVRCYTHAHTLCLFSAVKRMLLSALCAQGPGNSQIRMGTHTSLAGLGRDAVRPPEGFLHAAPT